MLGKRLVRRRLGMPVLALLALVLPLCVITPVRAAEAPPAELRHVCIDAQRDVIYAADPSACGSRETLRTLPDDRPARWCADSLGRLKESTSCRSRERAITVPDDGPVFVCARNLVGGTTQSRGALRTVLDLSDCEHDETGLVTPAAPEGVADLYTIDEDTPLVVPAKGVLANDVDLTGAPLTADLVAPPAEGTLTFESSGGFRFDPRGVFDALDVGQSATTTFRYVADDGALASEPTTVTLRITGRNDRPAAGDDVFVTDEDTALQVSPTGVLVNDSDAEGHPLSSVLVRDPARGALTLRPDGGLRFDPRSAFQHLGATPGEAETVTFEYVARDGTTDSDEATVSLRVVGVNDAPVGAPDAFTTDENTTVDIDPAALVANDADAEGQAITATSLALVGSGVGTLTPLPDGRLRYDPDADSGDPDGDPDLDHLVQGQTATVGLTYVATDASGLGSAPVTVTITVHGRSAPTANDDVRSTDEDHAVALDVFTNDQVRGGLLSLDTSATEGSATVEHDGVVRYDPSGAFDELPAGAATSDSFAYTLTNDEGSSTGAVTVQVTGVNDAPVAQDDVASVSPGTVHQVPAPGVLANDEDVDTPAADLRAVLVSPPDRGRLTLRPDGSFSFDPGGDFPAGGTTMFSYRADDGTDESATAEVVLQVFTNVPPSFDGDPYDVVVVVTDPAGASVGQLTAHDDDGDPLTFSVVDADTTAFVLDPTSGELSIGPAGPPAVGEHTLVVDVNDGRGGSDRATVRIRVVPELNAVDDHYTAVGNTRLVGSAPVAGVPSSQRAVVHVAGVLANDGGSTGQVLPATGLPTSAGGSVDLAADGSFVYTPPAADPGAPGAWDGISPLTDSFGYTIEGEGVDDPTGEVTIHLLDAVWYVDNQAAAGGSGTAWSPFASLSPLSGAGDDPDQPGQTLFLFGHPDVPDTSADESAYPGGVALEDRQELIGHGVGLHVADGARQLTLITAGATPRVSAPAAGQAIALARDNALRGLAVSGEGAGIVGSDVGALDALVAAVRTAGSPLQLAGTGAVDVRIETVTATGTTAEVSLHGLGGSVVLGTVQLCTGATEPCAGDGSTGLPVSITEAAGLVEVARADLGNAGLGVVDSTATGQVIVGTLTASGPDAGIGVTSNLGTVSVADVDLTGVVGTGVSLLDDDGTTTLGDGRVVGAATSDDALFSVGGGSAGILRSGADLTATPTGSGSCDAVLVQGVDAGGVVEIGGRVLGHGCGIRVDGGTAPISGAVRFLGGMDVHTVGSAAFAARAVPAPGRLEVLPSLAGSVLGAGDHAVLVMDDVRVGAAGVRFNRTDATADPGAEPAVTGIEITAVSAEAGPGLLVNGGTISTPGQAGATLTGSAQVTLRGLRVDQSARDGIVVTDSRATTLDGVRVQQPDGAGITATGSDDLLVDNTTVVAAGSYGIHVSDLAGRTTLRGSSVSDSRDTQLHVSDGTTPAGAIDELVVQSSVFSGGEAEDDSIVVLARQDEGAATPSHLRFEVSGDTPAGSIGGDTGLAATAQGGADLQVALSRFAVADTADDAIALHADGAGTSLDFALNTLNTSGGGGIQLAGAAGIRVDATGGAVTTGSMSEVAVLTTQQSGIVLQGVTDVSLGLVSVQATQQDGIEVSDSSGVTLDQVEVTRPSRHGLSVARTSNLVVDDSRFDLRPPTPVSASAPASSMPRFSAIRLQQLAGSGNAVTDTTLRGSTGDQLSLLQGSLTPTSTATPARIRLSGLTVLDTAVDPVIGRTSSTSLPVPDGDAVAVRAAYGADLDVDLSGGPSTVDETVRLLAQGGDLTVTGGHRIEHVSRDTATEREDSEADESLALVARGSGSTLHLGLDGLDVVQQAPAAGVPLPGPGVLVEADLAGSVSTAATDPTVVPAAFRDVAVSVPPSQGPGVAAMTVVGRDGGALSDLVVVGGSIAAAQGPAVLLFTASTPPPATFPPTPPPPPGTIDGVLIEDVGVAPGSGDGIVAFSVGCLDLVGNDTTAVAGTGYVLADSSLVDFTQPTVAAWLTAKGNTGPPPPRFELHSDVSPGECS